MPVIPNNHAFVQISMLQDSIADPQMVTFGTTDLSGDPVDAAQELSDAFWDNWGAQMGNNWNPLPTRALVRNGSGDLLEGFHTPTQLPAGSVERPPANCALLVQKRTALAGRTNRGRMFIPGVVTETTVQESGVIDNATVVALQAVAVAFLADIAATSRSMVILHSEETGPVLPVAPVVTQLVVQNILGTQRRRMR